MPQECIQQRTVQLIGSLRGVHVGKDDLNVDAGGWLRLWSRTSCSDEIVEEILSASVRILQRTVAQIADLPPGCLRNAFATQSGVDCRHRGTQGDPQRGLRSSGACEVPAFCGLRTFRRGGLDGLHQLVWAVEAVGGTCHQLAVSISLGAMSKGTWAMLLPWSGSRSRSHAFRCQQHVKTMSTILTVSAIPAVPTIVHHRQPLPTLSSRPPTIATICTIPTTSTLLAMRKHLNRFHHFNRLHHLHNISAWTQSCDQNNWSHRLLLLHCEGSGSHCRVCTCKIDDFLPTSAVSLCS